MSRTSGARRIRNESASVSASMGWLLIRADAPFKAGMALLWAFILLVAAALTLDWLLRPDNFPVENVNFEGRFERVTRQQLMQAMTDQVRGNFFAVDLDAVKARVESLPWIYRASVRRTWPRDLHIRFTEQQLVAHWDDDVWVNHSGELVRLAEGAPPAQLPQLRGPEGTDAYVLAHYRGFERALAPIRLHAMSVTLTCRRTWQVQLDNGVTLVLGREDPDMKIKRFARVYPQALVGHESRIKQVDLRYTNGFSVEWIEPPRVLAGRGLARGH